MTTMVEQCAHPIEARSTLQDGQTQFCVACQTRLNDAPQKTVCAAEPETKVEAIDAPAVSRVMNTATAAEWTTELKHDGDTITVWLSRAGETGHVIWKRNDEGAWRFASCLIGGVRLGARAIADRLAQPPRDPLATVPKPAQPADIGPVVATVVKLAGDGLAGLGAAAAAVLAPAPPAAVPTMPTGTLATFMAAPVKAVKVRGNTEWAAQYADELRGIIHYHGRNSARNLQVHLGPSELGVPCDRQVAWKLAGVPETNNVTDPWASIVGTGAHLWLADAFKAENQRNGMRWIPEFRVTPHPDHEGTADLYDGRELAVVDWKNLGTDKIESIAAKGPSIQYKIQLLLYGRGYRNLGLPVKRVVLVALPRTKSTLDGMYVWDHELTAADDELIEEVFRLTATRKLMADDIRAGRVHPLAIPSAPDSDTCYFCPFYRPESGHNGSSLGCPGTVH